MNQTFNVVVRPETSGNSVAYVAQCIEVNISVQGATLEECQSRFLKAVRGHCAYSEHLGETPFANLPPVPEEWISHFKQQRATTSNAVPLQSDRQCSIGRETVVPDRAMFAIA